jgi:hypothetical protein
MTMWQGLGKLPVQMLSSHRVALSRTQGTLGYARVPAFKGSDCSSVVGYAHSTTLWSTPVQSVVLVRAA